MQEQRRQRIASFLQHEIASIIQTELKDPRIGFVSITRVEPTDDLKVAKVHVSIMGDDAQQRTSMRGLEAAAHHMRSLLGQRVHFRQTPELRFIQDDSIRKQMEMDDLIKRAREEDEQAREERGDT